MNTFNRINTDVPCYQCNKREMLCHSNCADYKNWHAEQREEKEKIRIEKQIDYDEVVGRYTKFGRY